MGQCRRRDLETLGRAGEMALLGQYHEVAEQAKIEVAPLFDAI
jgi:hypothetical protein